MRRKKICFCVTLAGTFKSFLLDFSRYLISEHNYDVTVICSRDDSMGELTGEYLHYIPVNMKRGLSLDGLIVIPKMYKIFKQEEFDIVQYSTRNAGTYASIAAWMAGIKCRLYCQWGMMYVALRGIKRFMLWLDEIIITHLSTTIEAESFSMYEKALSKGIYNNEKASVIWNGSACGVNLTRYELINKNYWRNKIREQYGIEPDACVFGYCGRITRDKGLNELFAAFKELQNKRTAYLMIIGAYDNPETINRELFNWAQSCSHIIFTGRTDNVPMYYSALDVFISLSYREGFGLVVIEAAAMAIPGIVSDALGQRDTIKDMVSGLSVPTKNIEKVVDAMVYCIDNPERVIEMGTMARKDVEEMYDQSILFRKLADHRNILIGG